MSSAKLLCSYKYQEWLKQDSLPLFTKLTTKIPQETNFKHRVFSKSMYKA